MTGDGFEPNDSIQTATVLGSINEVTIRDLSIDTDSDVDFFRYTAHETGKLAVNVRFIHAEGDLGLEIFDVSGNKLGESNMNIDDETLLIPVVSQQDYFIRIFGSESQLNKYTLEIENFAVPVPHSSISANSLIAAEGTTMILPMTIRRQFWSM